MTDSELLTYGQVSARVQCSDKHLRDKYVKPGLLKCIRRGPKGRWIRFLPSEVERFLRWLAGDGTGGIS
jgi:hypothetical protein